MRNDETDWMHKVTSNLKVKSWTGMDDGPARISNKPGACMS